jgi:ABC-type sugar transport system ATPase subunit
VKTGDLVVQNVSLTHADRVRPHRALRDVSLHVPMGHTLAIVGPSGAGKSSLLRVIAGLAMPQHGSVMLGDVRLDAIEAQRRRIALVFQYDALFPTMTVRANLRFALRNGASDAHIDDVARALAVDAHLSRMPRDLSGGERQRISLARALLSDPLALLLDEPLAHLDPSLRAGVRDSFRDLRSRFEGPALYVTHDHAEAMVVGDTLGVLIDGALEDCGDPQRVYDAPANTRVAAFLGSPPMNLIADGAMTIGIRPEYVRLHDGEGAIRGVVEQRDSAGADAFVRVRTGRGVVTARVPASQSCKNGDSVTLEFPPERVRRFDARTGAAIS